MLKFKRVSLVIACIICVSLALSQNVRGIGNGATTNSGINTNSISTVTLEKPSFKYYCINELINRDAKTVGLKMISNVKDQNYYEDNLKDVLLTTNSTDKTSKDILNTGMPLTYENTRLLKIIKGKDSYLGIYGVDWSEGRYLVSLDLHTKKINYALDFINYIYSPDYVKESKDYVYQQLVWAMESDGILYVSNSHMTYASSSKGMNSYITAIRLSDKKVIWRSNSLVANSMNFVIIGDSIISGYGFTAEPDFLYTINKYNGKTLRSFKLKDAPESIVYKNQKLYIKTYSRKYTFNVELKK